MGRILRLALLFGLVALVLTGASSADNHGTATDPVGDNETYAPDITGIEMTTHNDGYVNVRVTLNDPGGQLAAGQWLNVFVDNDNDLKTGDQGYEVQLYDGGNGDLELCTYTDRWTCSPLKSDEASDTPTGPNTHLVSFTVYQSNWAKIKFFVESGYQAADGQPAYYDDAPDGAPNNNYYIFDTNADPDHDGYTGDGDTCPNVASGPVDRNQNGCPDKLPVPIPGYALVSRPGGRVFLAWINARNATPAMKVTARFPGFAVGPTTGSARLHVNRELRIGSKVTLVMTHRKRPGRFVVLRIGAAGLTPIRAGCTPIGSTKLLPKCPPS